MSICSLDAERLIEDSKSRTLSHEEKIILLQEAFRLMARVDELLEQIENRCIARTKELTGVIIPKYSELQANRNR